MTPVQQNEVMKMTLQGEKLKIEGAVENLERIKNLFTSDTDFDLSYDSLGNIILVKKQENIYETTGGEQVFFMVEDMPEFPGGETALSKFISNSIIYPELAVEKGIQGKVYVAFVVTQNGKVANAKIAQGIDPALDKEALRVVNSLPLWKPGKQGGQNVNVSYTVPINFMLDSYILEKSRLAGK